MKLPTVKTGLAPYPNLEVFIEGMSNKAEAGGSVMLLEFYEDKWQLHVWADINNEDPTHTIDMSGAMESNLAAGGTK